MKSSVLRYSVLGIGTSLAVAVMVPVIPFLASTRGVAGPAMTDAVHPVSAAIALAIGVGCCCAIACVVGKLINAAVGLCVLGFGLAIISTRSGTIMDAAFDGDTLLPIALETLAWAGAIAAMAALVFRVSGPLVDLPPMNPRGTFLREVVNTDALRGLAAGIAAVAVMWLLDRTEMKGQSLGAATCAGIATAFAGRRMQGASQPILLFAAPVLAIGVAQLVTAFMLKGPLVNAVVGRALPGWSMAMPLDVAAGALVGVAIGLGWTRNAPEDE